MYVQITKHKKEEKCLHNSRGHRHHLDCYLCTQRSVDESVAEDVPEKEPQVGDEVADMQRALEESMKSMYDVPRGPLPPVVIREPEFEKYQPLPEVPRKGKAKVTEEQVAHDLLNPGNAETSQPIPSPVVHVGSDREHINLDVADVSPQPLHEQMDEGFTVMAYPKVQENLKLTVEEQVLLEEPASSSGTISSLQHLSKDLSFDDLFFSDKPSKSDNDKATAKTEVESMVPESPKGHQQLKAIVTETTTTSLPPPYQQQQSTTDAMMMKRIGDLEHIMANLIQKNKKLEQRLDSHEARLYTLEQLDIPHQVSKAINEVVTDAPPPLPPPAGPSGASGSPGAFGSSQVSPLPPPPPSTNQESQSKGSVAPSSSKTAEYQAWTTTDIRLRPSISLTPADLQMDEDMAPDEQVQSSDDEDIRSAHIPKVNLRQDWWKPLEEERPATLEPAWSIPSSDVPILMNNWASALASNYSPPPEDSLLVQTGDIAMFMDWFCKRRGVTELKPQDLEGPTIKIVKVFHPDVIHLQYQ
nr:hypothetical protein [Tanacetum cinerariifolium]